MPLIFDIALRCRQVFIACISEKGSWVLPSGLSRIICQMGDTPGALSGPSTYPCAIEMPYSQTYILETVSGLEHLPDVNEAHLKSSVGSFFGQFGEVKLQKVHIMRLPWEGGWRILGFSPTSCDLRLIIIPFGPLFTQSAVYESICTVCHTLC